MKERRSLGGPIGGPGVGAGGGRAGKVGAGFAPGSIGSTNMSEIRLCKRKAIGVPIGASDTKEVSTLAGVVGSGVPGALPGENGERGGSESARKELEQEVNQYLE